MTKRFQLFKHKNEEYILDEPNVHLDFIEMLGDALSFEEIVDLLNAFNEENEQLKQEMGNLGTAHAEEINKIEDEFDEEILKLKKENEQLKKQLDETIEGLHKEITTSENAFEGLMNENKELRDACKNYDWYKLYNQLLNENEQLKSFIKSLASPDGKIWLSSGYGYRIDKILNDFNNTENDDGDVE